MSKSIFSTECKDTKKCSRIIKDFIKSVTTLKHKKVYINKGEDFATYSYVDCADDDFPIKIQYCYDQLATSKSSGEHTFFVNAYVRSNRIKGFSKLTLSLLHELGHNETAKLVNKDYDRDSAIDYMNDNIKSDDEKNYFYFSLPDEWLATQWMITWLQDKNNRKLAKDFEKKFFNIWKGNK